MMPASPGRLLRQPHGFEGGRPVLVVIDVDDLVVLDLELGVEADVDLETAGLAPGRDVDGGDVAVAALDYLLQIDPVLVPGVEPATPGFDGSGDLVDGREVLLDLEPRD